MKLRPSLGIWPFLLSLSLLAIIPPPTADGAVVVTRSTDPEFSSFGLTTSIGSMRAFYCDEFTGMFCSGPPVLTVGIGINGTLSNHLVYYGQLESLVGITQQPFQHWNNPILGGSFGYQTFYWDAPQPIPPIYYGGSNYIHLLDPVTNNTSWVLFTLDYGSVTITYREIYPQHRNVDGRYDALSLIDHYHTYTSVPIVNFQAVAIGPGLTLGDAQAAIANSAVSTVPEPTSFLASLIVCCIGILYRRRPRRSA